MKPPKLEEFHQRAGAEWAAAIQSLGIGRQSSTVWSDLEAIEEALQPFMGSGRNHALLPSGGGADYLSIGRSEERNCLEAVAADRGAYVFKPRSLTLEHFPQQPQESFLLLELKTLKPSGLYQGDDDDYEELLDVPGKGYMRREIWDRGFIGYDDDGREIAVPDSARIVSRLLSGKILLVANGSIWNTRSGYDGEHNQMTAAQIRALIERAISG